MYALNRIAYYQNRRDEVPNLELARDLAAREDETGIREIADNLWNREPNICSDCIKVLYEIGYLKPDLIAPYAGDFLKLLGSRNNRLVWGGMIALSTIAGIAADQVYPHVGEIERVMERGTFITIDAGVLALSRMAATADDRKTVLLPYLFEFLRSCRPSDVPRHAERVLMAVTARDRDEFIAVLRARTLLLTPAQAARLKKVIWQAEAR
jgi:hypothetical protein